MKRTYVSLMAFGLAAVAAVAVYAQQPAATPPPPKACTLTPAQIAEGRSVAIAFQTSTGDARVALADPTYNQHNPAFKKRAEEAKKTDFEEFRDNFSSAALAARAGGPGGGGGRGPAAAGATQPPGPNNPFEVVLTECDTTIMVHKTWRPDPVTPGRWFEAFTFDMFRVKNGKLVEHWDTAVINPPAPAGGAPGGAPAGAPPARGN